MKPRRMFLDVGFDGQKILMDEASSFLVFIGLGLQPSTAPSAGSCAKVQQNRSILLLGRGKRLINVLAPIYGHNSPPPAGHKSENPCGQRLRIQPLV
jgi:hypothetical protein